MNWERYFNRKSPWCKIRLVISDEISEPYDIPYNVIKNLCLHIIPFFWIFYLKLCFIQWQFNQMQYVFTSNRWSALISYRSSHMTSLQTVHMNVPSLPFTYFFYCISSQFGQLKKSVDKYPSKAQYVFSHYFLFIFTRLLNCRHFNFCFFF